MKVDDKLVDLPAGLKGLVVLNIPRYVKSIFSGYFQDIIQFVSWEQGLNHGDHTMSRSERDLSDYIILTLF